MPMDREDWERLKKIQDELRGLLKEAKNLIRLSGNRMEYERAKAYWLAHIEFAVDKVNPYDLTMEDTIKALEPEQGEPCNSCKLGFHVKCECSENCGCLVCSDDKEDDY